MQDYISQEMLHEKDYFSHEILHHIFILSDCSPSKII